jgi:hypothetical protein
MPEWLGADKKQKIDRAHAEAIAALDERGVHLSEEEAQRLREKLGAYISKTNPDHIDVPTSRDAIAEKINAPPQTRLRVVCNVGFPAHALGACHTQPVPSHEPRVGVA